MQVFLDLFECLFEASILIWHGYFFELADVLRFNLGKLRLKLIIKDYTLIHAHDRAHIRVNVVVINCVTNLSLTDLQDTALVQLCS